MASFATSADLAARLQRSFSETEKDQAEQLLAGATARIRAITDQWISWVEDDVWVTDAPVSDVLWLPQRPVSTVASVLVDGVAVTDWRLRGSRLLRSGVWSDGCAPVEVQVTYSHGYVLDDEHLALAKDACLAIAAQRMSNPAGYKSESIDDYSRTFSEDDTDWSGLGKTLRLQYARRPRTGSISTAV